MLRIKTFAGSSAIEGIGVFAGEPTKAGQIIWEYHAGFDQEFTKEQIDALPPTARSFMLRYAYLRMQTGTYILSADHDRFTNHSDTPNCGAVDSDDGLVNQTVALRDIEAGEELTMDYRTFDVESGEKLSFDNE